ncbi:MAG: ABC transporter substrate-binding protein [Actinobacteria bacterium]|nr:ABC transporter substrate-binding protein [Actinomycetota bacterium]
MRRAGIALLLAVSLSACGGGGGAVEHVVLTLDWTPNPDHVGFYYARDAGLFRQAELDVAIRAPSDPAAPLKLVAAGGSDLAVSYEQEVFFAAAKKLPVVAVAAVVGQPLNSIMSIDPAIHGLADLKGRSIGITGVPADYAALVSAGLAHDVRVVNVGYTLLPALLSHKVDAVLGMYRNVEGVELEQRGFHPTVIPLDRAGVPTYDELVLVASAERLRSSPEYARMVGRFVAAFLEGTADAQRHPERSLRILGKVTASDHAFLARSTPATLALLGRGCLSEAAWRRFGAWMHDRGLLKSPVSAADVMTTRFLGAHCQ